MHPNFPLIHVRAEQDPARGETDFVLAAVRAEIGSPAFGALVRGGRAKLPVLAVCCNHVSTAAAVPSVLRLSPHLTHPRRLQVGTFSSAPCRDLVCMVRDADLRRRPWQKYGGSECSASVVCDKKLFEIC